MLLGFCIIILNMEQKGFTLIEILLYLGLFSIVIGGGMVAVYQIIQSTNATNDKVVIQEDADFLLRKLDWALTGARPSDISSVTSTSITIGTLTFSLSGNNLTLNTAPLNSSFVRIAKAQVSGVDVDIFNLSGNKVQVSFTVNGQRFDESKYLH